MSTCAFPVAYPYAALAAILDYAWIGGIVGIGLAGLIYFFLRPRPSKPGVATPTHTGDPKSLSTGDIDEAERRILVLQRLNDQLVRSSADVVEFVQKLEWQNARLEDLNDRLKLLAYTDGLTGLFNHRTFRDRLASAFAQSRRYGQSLSLIMLDVDHFKQLNDTYGHPVGDAVLVEIANAITEVIRESDVAARYGGEEFCVLLSETELAGAVELADRLRISIQKIENTVAWFTVSIGVSEMTSEMTDAAEFLRLADTSLYEAKRRGRNRVVALQAEPRRKKGA